MNDVQEKLWNIDLLVDDIKKFPQTYKTILKDCYKDGTCQTILRRKLNKLFKDGDICKSSIPGTRFGEAIIYVIPKKYHILVEAGRLGSRVYCFFEYEKMSRYYIKVIECWELKGKMWKKLSKERTFFEGNILKFL